MVHYPTATVEQIADHFSTVTRQRVQQLLQKYKKLDDWPIVEKIIQAKRLLKQRRYEEKRGCTLAEHIKTSALWAVLTQKVGKRPAYLDCTLAFTSEADFRQWAIKQVGFSEEGFELDKDILIKGNRVYGPDTCVFVPQELNSLFASSYKPKNRGPYPPGVSFNKGSGTFVAQMHKEKNSLDKYLGSFKTVEDAFACYKAAKEEKIKRLAEKWRDKIDPKTYAALLARTVEWDD